MSYREATQQEIARAGQEANFLEDWKTAKSYADAVYGPTVARIQFVVDHNFDDGEENRYISSDDEHTAWDGNGNQLPAIGQWSEWGDMPEFNDYEPWHMVFDFTETPTVTRLYVQVPN